MKKLLSLLTVTAFAGQVYAVPPAHTDLKKLYEHIATLKMVANNINEQRHISDSITRFKDKIEARRRVREVRKNYIKGVQQKAASATDPTEKKKFEDELKKYQEFLNVTKLMKKKLKNLNDAIPKLEKDRDVLLDKLDSKDKIAIIDHETKEPSKILIDQKITSLEFEAKKMFLSILE